MIMIVYFISTLISLLSLGRVYQNLPESGNLDCIECHGDLLNNNVIHPDLESSCDICHNSTGEDHPKENVRGFSLTENIPVLCFICHSDLQEQSESAEVTHGPFSSSPSCLSCHNPHSSENANLLKKGTNNLCLDCHNRSISRDSLRISNIRQKLTNAKSVHSPVDDGCTTCHNPHFSERRTLLIADFTDQQYINAKKENFDLCFICHDSDLFDAKETEIATNFRNGSINLHYLHVNREKGRNCNMCHEIHGSINDRLILDKLKFGNWEMKFRFNITENGGSCLTGCHSEKSYDRTIFSEEIPPDQPKSEE